MVSGRKDQRAKIRKAKRYFMIRVVREMIRNHEKIDRRTEALKTVTQSIELCFPVYKTTKIHSIRCISSKPIKVEYK